MAWRNGDPEKRRRDAEIYGDPVYRRNRQTVLRRANGRCEQCGRRRPLEVDHVRAISLHGVDHSVENLQALCCGPGSCHAAKSAQDAHAAPRSRRRSDPEFTPTLSEW